MAFTGFAGEASLPDRAEFRVSGILLDSLAHSHRRRPGLHRRRVPDSSAHVLVVTESTARRFWPGETPLPKRLQQTHGSSPVDFEVIGVAKDTVCRTWPTTTRAILAYLTGPSVEDGRTCSCPTDYASTADAGRASFRRSIGICRSGFGKLADNFEVWRLPSRIAAFTAGVLGARPWAWPRLAYGALSLID